MIVTTPAERATPQAMASYGIFETPSITRPKRREEIDDGRYVSIAAFKRRCNGRINSHVPTGP
jgi:hypothetical protein